MSKEEKLDQAWRAEETRRAEAADAARAADAALAMALAEADARALAWDEHAARTAATAVALMETLRSLAEGAPKEGTVPRAGN